MSSERAKPKQEREWKEGSLTPDDLTGTSDPEIPAGVERSRRAPP
jgi:hypothetical protein